MRTPEEIARDIMDDACLPMHLMPVDAVIRKDIANAIREARAAALDKAAKAMEAFWANLEDERSAQEQAAAAIRALQEPAAGIPVTEQDQ